MWQCETVVILLWNVIKFFLCHQILILSATIKFLRCFFFFFPDWLYFIFTLELLENIHPNKKRTKAPLPAMIPLLCVFYYRILLCDFVKWFPKIHISSSLKQTNKQTNPMKVHVRNRIFAIWANPVITNQVMGTLKTSWKVQNLFPEMVCWE